MKQRTGRKLMSFLFALALVLGLMSGMSSTAFAKTGFEYLYWNGSSLVEDTCTDFTVVSGGGGTISQPWGTQGADEAWYVVNDDVTINYSGDTSAIELKCPVHLVICDGKKLTINCTGGATGISCGGNSLTIHGQSGKSGTFEVKSNGHGIYLGFSGHEPLTIYGVNGEVASTANTDNKLALSSNAHVTVIDGKLELTATNNGQAGAAGQASIYVGAQTVVYASNDGMPVVGDDNLLTIKKSGTDTYVEPRGKKYVLITTKPHTHNFTYSASDATITATCNEEGCPLDDGTAQQNHAVKLTIAAPTDLIASTTSHTASLTGLGDFKEATKLSVADTDILYYEATRADDGKYSKKGNTPLASAPNDKGDYIAEITLTGVKTADSAITSVTASVGYSLVESYNIWIANELITSDKLDGTGWSYAADTKTLTLDGFSSDVCHVGDMHTAILYYEGTPDLKIQFTGTNTLDASNSTTGGSGIYSNSGKIILEGSGTLDLKGKNTAGGAGVFMNSSAELIINKGTITAEGRNGISGKTTINGGDVTAIATGGQKGALDSKLINTIPGKGWNDAAASGSPEEIAISNTERYVWGYYKVHFPHIHDFTYSASDATITATCTADGCPLPPSTQGASDHAVALTLSADDATYTGNPYAGASLSDTTAWTGAGLTEPTIVYVGRGDTTYPESETAPTDAGTYTASITVDTVTATADFEISPIALTITGAKATDRTYVKDSKDVEISGVTFEDSSSDPVQLALDTDYTVTGAMADADAGEGKNVDVTVTLVNGNYSLEKPTTTTTVNISKAGAQTIEDVKVSLLYTATSVSESVAGKMPNDAGTLTYTKGTAASTGSVTVSDFAVDTSGKVTATLSGGAVGNTVTLPVTIGSDNYADSTANVKITLEDKGEAGVKISGVPEQGVTYGDADFTLTGSVTDPGTGTGVWTWESSDDTVLGIKANGATATVKILKAGSANVTVGYESDTTKGNNKDAITVGTQKITIAAKDQSIYVGGDVPTLDGEDFYTVTGLVGKETLTTEPTLAYQKGGSAANPDNTKADTYDIVPSGAAASDNYTIEYTNGTLTISDKGTQTITADDVTAIYGDTDKKVVARVTDPAEGGGAISYAVKDGSRDYIDVDATSGALTIKKVPADGKAYVTVTAAETASCKQATKDVTVTISPADKTTLNKAIADAEAYYDTIKDKAEYAEVAAALKKAIDAAKEVAANDNVTESAVAQAIKDVNGAVDKAKADVAAIDKQAADEAAARAVIDAIDKLPAEAGVKDKEAVEAARKAYEALTDDQKKLVPEETVKKLTTAEEQVKAAEADEAAAKAVVDAIGKLPAEAGVKDKEAVEAARKAYEALSDSQKKLVPEDAVKKLTTAEEQVKAAEADEAAAQAVIDAIKALPAEAGLDDKAAVEAARAAYDALTEDQKKLVPEDVVKKLTDAEEQVQAAEEAAETISIKKCKITVKNRTYTGKAVRKPVVTVMYGKVKLKEGRDYTLTYNKKAKKIGTYKLIVKGKGKYKGSRKLTFKIVPKGTAFTKLTGGKKQITLKWKQRKNIRGYQIQYSLKKNFSGGKKVTVKAGTLTRTIKKLKAGKKYYVRIRTYAKVKGKVYYSAWSKAKTVKTVSAKGNAGQADEDESPESGEDLTLPGIDIGIDDGMVDGIGMDGEIELTME